MQTGLKITAFAAAVAATFGTAYGVGKSVDPVTAGEQKTAGHAGEDTRRKRKRRKHGTGTPATAHRPPGPLPSRAGCRSPSAATRSTCGPGTSRPPASAPS